MKHISFKLAFMAVVLAFAGTTFTACEDDIEITNGTTNPWENVDGQFGAVRSAAGAKMGATLTTKNGESATGHVYFELSKVAEQDTKVTFKIDADALTAYNAANGTNYTAYEGATLSNNGEVTIPAGKRISDYIDVNIPAGKSGNAVAITATADNGVTISSNNSTYIYQVKSVTYPQHNKAIKNLCYIEVNNENPLNAGEYTLSNGEPFFDIVSIFAANINLDSDGKPYIYCNEQVTYVLHNADKIIRPLQEKGIKVHLSILGNHDDAGMRSLSEEGAKLLDPSGNLEAGIPLCPPEGDAGTGMVATNSVTRKTGNVSAGTSVFAMIVLEKELKKVYDEIDLVTTPSGDLVGMVHCNNCTSDLNAWVNLFKEFAQNFGVEDVDMDQLYGTLYNKALEGDKDCGGLLAYNYFSGEHITGFEEGRPLFVRKPDSNFNLANFMRVHLYTALGALKTGLDILMKEEDVKVDKMLGHGGLFKTEGVGQKIMAAAVNAPVSVMKTAGEGGAWGMAILAAYMLDKAEDEMLDTYLSDKVFAGEEGTTIAPDEKDVEGFDEFIKQYQKGLALERVAIDVM